MRLYSGNNPALDATPDADGDTKVDHTTLASIIEGNM